MDMFYKYLGISAGGKKAAAKPKTAAPKPGEKVVNTAAKPQENDNQFVDGLLGVLTSVKNVQINYTENSGTVLPGYTPGVGFLGSSRPSLGFIFGSQDDVRYEAAKNGWLTDYQDFNQNFSQVINRMFKATANVDLFPDFKIDLTADRSYSKNFSEQYDIFEGQYNPRSPYTYGLVSISTFLIKTSFSASDENASAPFDDYRNNRLEVANRLAIDRQKYDSSYDPTIIDADGFPKGYGKNNQAVLLPAFLAAYSGSDASGVSLGIFRSFPIPNWSVKYSGLMRYDLFKRNFKRFSLQHNYKASYTINQYRSNFDKTPNGVDASGNFFNKTIMSN